MEHKKILNFDIVLRILKPEKTMFSNFLPTPVFPLTGHE
jgi:hypothetical protein